MNSLQVSIMHAVNVRGRLANTPVSFREIVSELGEGFASEDKIKYSIRALIKKGYLRRPAMRSKSACYVQLRGMGL